MRAIIIDDERPARSEMRRLLLAHPDIEVVGDASTASEAEKMIKEMTPDLIFLDVQMHDETGFDLLERLAPPFPQVIFTTAHEEHALRAFEVDALDYLLKPIDPVRLNEALQRAAKRAKEANADVVGTRMFHENDRVYIREEDRCWYPPLRDIRLLESDGNYIRVYFSDVKATIYRSLNTIEARLPEALFFRANRSQIINLALIDTIENWFSGNLKVRLIGGDEVEISRRQSLAFRERASL